jgi:hypothetical protein
MSLENRLGIQGLCNQLEELVGKQDINFGYFGIREKVHFSILGGKFAEADKEFNKALKTYESSKNQQAVLAALDDYLKRMSERP